MSDHDDDPLLGLLTDIAEGVAVLVDKVDRLEARIAAQDELVNNALAAIAEVATRTYFAAKPASCLPDEVVNSGVMDAMIERWPRDAVINFSSDDREFMNDLASQTVERINGLIVHTKANPDPSNAGRLRQAAGLALLNREMDKRAKAQKQSLEREDRGRGR
jgi:hypothetical protein